MKLVEVKKLAAKLFMFEGDILNVTWNDNIIVSHPITKESTVDKIEIYELEEESGYKNGYAVFLGESL